MFYVWDFAPNVGEWKPVGAFTTEADVDALVASLTTASHNCSVKIEETFEQFIDRVVHARLGQLADTLDKMFGGNPDPMDLTILWGRGGLPVAIAPAPSA